MLNIFMNLYNIFNIILSINNLINGFKIFMNNKLKLNDLKRFSLLSKVIYDYDYKNVHKHYNKNNYIFDINKNNLENITTDFTQTNNIYFNVNQFITSLDNKDFIKNTEKYLSLLNNFFPNIKFYSYFYDKKKIFLFILLNHVDKEIIVIFKGSQYRDEWIQNLKLKEKIIDFNEKKYKIHSGMYDMYRDDNIDTNIIYILKNLFNYFPKYRKIFTGHSKGTINNILLSFELTTKLDKKYNYEIFNLGTPPLFNYDFGLYLHNHSNIFINNVMNDLDIITLLPLNKYHVGLEILLKNNNITIKKHMGPYKLENRITFNNILKSIESHDLNAYIKKIFENKIIY